ncbi:MAG: hypothetical protein ABI833_16805 [Acidobacteriota bacterium]
MGSRTHLPRIAAGAALLAVAAALVAERLEDTIFIPLDHPAILYEGATTDPVGRLAKRLAAGELKLDYAPNGWGYLPALLKQLGISTDSQVLVFSRTSIQVERISPRTPRAIYFNDDSSVGYVQNGEALELASLDPRQGVILYSLDPARSPRPVIGRRDDCLRCHQGPVTLAVPGLLISSVQPTTGRGPDHGNAVMTDHRTPFNQRWGGWYVTGTHGAQTHLGNNPALGDPIHPGAASLEGTQNVTDLSQFLDTSRYLVPSSDLVALLVLEHQTRMTNLIVRIGWDARVAQHDGKLAAERARLDDEIDELVGYMLFGDEAPLHQPVAGVSAFSKTFPQRGPHDKQGRSLRDFDLRTRLFRYPLSYMIYSAAFDGMPGFVRDRVYQRLYDILSGKDSSPSAGGLSLKRLSADDRQAILEIVRETKPNLPASWTAAGVK